MYMYMHTVYDRRGARRGFEGPPILQKHACTGVCMYVCMYLCMYVYASLLTPPGV